ncbi:MAG: DUF1697 domain-containing protein [Flavobacteriaceae bacterium]|nr:DUF1697 domain-containing protein [Flavobacteriaceae bacterium]
MMQTYICLLRGINVSGQKKIKMAELKVLFEGLGFKDVITYIQSGNIIFKSEEKDARVLENLIHQMLLNDFGFDITVIVITPKEIQYAATNNPFEQDKTKDPKKFYVVFLQERPQPAKSENLARYNYSPEEYSLVGRLVFFYAANGAGKAKMTNNFFESKLKVKASSRNWRTVHKLVELSK